MGISFDIFFNDWYLIIPANSNLKCPNSPQANGVSSDTFITLVEWRMRGMCQMKIMPSFHFYRWLLLILRILWKYGIISMPTKKLRGVSPEGGTDFPYIISIYISNIQNYHNFRLNNVNDFIFAPRLSIDKKNIFWDFCGNPTWWRHFTSHDVILLYLAKISPIKLTSANNTQSGSTRIIFSKRAL